MFSELAHKPALVPLPVQVVVLPEAPAGAATKPNEMLSATAVATTATDDLKRVQNRLSIFMVPSPCPIAMSGSPLTGTSPHSE
jgi:hypothetical protein